MVERQRRLLEVYAHLHDHCGVHTQKDLAHILRYSRVYISSALNGNEKNLTDKLFKSICEAFPETFNLNYLLTGEGELSGEEPSQVETKKFTFTVKGDFKSPTFNKSKMRKAASALADDEQLTDLWVFDYQDGAVVQTLHQSAGDAEWGKPVLNLTYGHHDVCFVASRGTTPTVYGDVITWEKPSDTFWVLYAVDVVGTSNGNRSVTLDRVATRLRITPTDEVPSNAAKVTITPAVWYYGLNVLTGEPTEQRNTPREIAVPASYLGTTSKLTMSIFGLSAADEWTTAIDITATDASGVTIGKASIAAAPFKRNRSTDYSGPLFGTSGETSVMINNEWSEPFVGEW